MGARRGRPRALTTLTVDGLPAASGAELSEAQAARLRRVFDLNLSRRVDGTKKAKELGAAELLTILADLGMRPDQHPDERASVDELLASLRTEEP